MCDMWKCHASDFWIKRVWVSGVGVLGVQEEVIREGHWQRQENDNNFRLQYLPFDWGVIKFNQGVSSESISYILVELEPKFVWPGCWVLCVHNFSWMTFSPSFISSANFVVGFSMQIISYKSTSNWLVI